MLPRPRNSNLILQQPHTFLPVCLFACLFSPPCQRKYFRFLLELDSLTISSIFHSMLFWIQYDTAQLMQLPHELSTVLCYWHIKQVQARTFTYSLEMLSHSKCFLCNANYVRDMINYFQRNAFLRLFHVFQNNEMWNPRNATLERITETHVHEKWFTLILHVEIRTHALQSLSTTATKCVFVHENEGFSPRMLSVKLSRINKHRDCIHTNCHQRIKESKRMLGIVDNIFKMATSTTAEQRR